jgi:hypothetical protein
MYASNPNKIIKYDNYAEIILYDKHGFEKAKSKISLQDIPMVLKYRWHLTNKGYVKTTINSRKNTKRKEILLHRYLINVTDFHIQIDHIDEDKLNNQRDNLRICNNTKNHWNISDSNKNSQTGVRGIIFRKDRNKYLARIWKNGKCYHLGYFRTIEEAMSVRENAEKEMFNEFAPNREKGLINEYWACW